MIFKYFFLLIVFALFTSTAFPTNTLNWKNWINDLNITVDNYIICVLNTKGDGDDNSIKAQKYLDQLNTMFDDASKLQESIKNDNEKEEFSLKVTVGYIKYLGLKEYYDQMNEQLSSYLEKAKAENGEVIEKCIIAVNKAKDKVESAGTASEVAYIINSVTYEIKTLIGQSSEISKKYNLTQDEDNQIQESLYDKIEEFVQAGRTLGEKVGEAMIEFQYDDDGIQLINDAVENFTTIGD